MFLLKSKAVVGRHGGAVGSAVASQQEGPDFGSPAGPEFPPRVQRQAVRPIGHVSALQWTGDLSRMFPTFHSMTVGIGSSTPQTPKVWLFSVVKGKNNIIVMKI